LSTRESRLPPTLAIAFVSLLAVAFPERYALGGRWAPLAWGAALVIAMILPLELSRSPRAHALRRLTSTAVVTGASLMNVYFLVDLVYRLVYVPTEVKGILLIRAAAVIWLANIVIFSLWFWHLDRGGPEGRASSPQGRVEFGFPDNPEPGWKPTFLDYLFVAFTVALAFSPTDTMPLSHRTKMLMATEALVSFVTIAIVAARAVNILT
jgi:uncharacterized membrane protein